MGQLCLHQVIIYQQSKIMVNHSGLMKYIKRLGMVKQRNCENLVNPRLLESYSESFARYIQCKEEISQFGLLGTGGVITSPFVQMSSQFQKTANLLWYEIYDIVKENCTEVYEDYGEYMMEKLLRQRR